MKTVKILVVVCGLVGGLLGAAGAEARADDYAVVALDNPTTYTITYSVKWGDGAWKTYTLRPNSTMTHWIPDPNAACTVHFTQNIGYGGGTMEYNLPTYTSCNPCYDNARHYKFSLTSCRCYLNVYTK